MARLAKRRHGIELIVVDYLGLLAPDRHVERENRWRQVGEMAKSMKELAKELNVAVLLLSQLNRESEKRSDQRPTMADLRESGDVEAHADGVWLLHRPERYGQTDQNAGLVELILAKQRNGPTGTVELTWIGDQTRFEDRQPAAVASR
jgi:replicative DNA helicase